MNSNALNHHKRLVAYHSNKDVITHPIIEMIDNAIVSPIKNTSVNELGIFVQDSAVYYQDRRICKTSLHVSANLNHDNVPSGFPTEVLPELVPGTHLYGGV